MIRSVIFAERYAVDRLEIDEQQRREVVDDSLHDISDKTREHRRPAIFFH